MQHTFKFPSGREVTIGPPVKSATARKITPASLAQKAWNYSKAVIKWTKAGKPTRSEEEIAKCLAICEACPHFKPGKRPSCKLCGCALSNAPNGLTNKIAMATENCPIGKW